MSQTSAAPGSGVEQLARRLGEALRAAAYTYDGVAALLGPTAHTALMRNETTPGLRATTGGSAAETLTRLWLLQAPVPEEQAERALPGLVDALCAAGVLERSVSEVAARVDLRPYAADETDLWVASDLTPGLDGAPHRVGPDHVLGISSAATSLAQLTVRDPVGRALDLGTGCGVQALHLAGHVQRVVATDVNERALWLTRLNAALNGVTARVEPRAGSYFEPVRGELFDLVVTNPPFVISPATGDRLVYRDSGLPGDRVVEDIVRAAPRHLAPGGWCQVLANWSIRGDTPWEERVGSWLEDSGCDAWVVQREVVDLPSYVELWLKDAGLHPSTGPLPLEEYHRRYDTWLSWFADEGVEAVGFGWLNLRRPAEADTGPGVLRLEEWPYEVEQPLGPEVAAFGRRATSLRALTSDDDLLATRPVRRADVLQESLGEPGAADPAQIVLRQQRGLRRARVVDTVAAAVVGASDGDLSVGQLLDALAQLLDQDAGELRSAYLPQVRDLVSEGFLDLPRA